MLASADAQNCTRDWFTAFSASSQLSARRGLRSIPLISGHLLLLRIKFYVSFINSLALIKSTSSVSNFGINNSNGGTSRVREFGVPTNRWDVNEMLGFCLS